MKYQILAHECFHKRVFKTYFSPSKSITTKFLTDSIPIEDLSEIHNIISIFIFQRLENSIILMNLESKLSMFKIKNF